MKETLLSSLFITATLSLGAASLTPEQALARLGEQPRGAKGTGPAAMVTPTLLKTAELFGKPTYYVFGTSDQTLFVSADDAVVPLLGVVDNPALDLDALPPQMVWWLGEYSRQINWASERQNAKMNVKAPSSRASRASITPMLTTQWDQASPYNLLCPDQCYTGCVATAMAQVMKYWNYPEKGTGVVSVAYGGEKLTLDLSEKAFSWDKMLDSYSGTSMDVMKPAYRNAVAYLMQACGYSVDMTYTSEASGALSNSCVAALVDNFNYNPGIDIVQRDFCASQEEWENMVYQNLLTGPVYYCGMSTDAAHAFVCDGYRADDNLFHINWGWGGTSDGYFVLSALDPEEQGIGGGSSTAGYQWQQGVLTGVTPEHLTTTKAASYLGWNGRLLLTPMKDNSLFFSAENGMMANFGGYTANFYIYGTFENRETKDVYYTEAYDTELQAGMGYYRVPVELSDEFPDGEYNAYLTYKIDNEGDYMRVRTITGTPESIKVTVKDGVPTVAEEDMELVVDVELEGLSKTVVGKEFTVYVNVSSTFKEAVPYELYVGLCAVSNNTLRFVSGQEKIGSLKFDIPAESDDEYEIKATIGSTVTPGTDYYILVYTPDLNWYDYLPTVVYESSVSTAEATIEEATCSELAAKSPFDITLTLSNDNDEDATEELSVAVLTYKGGSYYFASEYLCEQRVVVPAHATDYICHLKGTIPALADGNYVLSVLSAGYILKTFDFSVSSSGISDIAGDAALDAAAELYDLSGRKVDAANAAHGIYVVKRADGTTAKVAR